jgi:uncharacterized tellurite resistance protein B-like protein
MYETIVNNQDQALCHLFFHVCLEDERFTEPEMNDLSAKLVALGLAPKVKIKDELISYRSYKPSITNERVYLRHLVQLINPVNELALYSYCAELCISDPVLDPREDALLNNIAEVLDISQDEEDIVQKLIAQRKAVELQKIF